MSFFRSRRNDTRKPYIVMIGDVGAGKSKLVEKICDERGRSSAGSTSVTQNTEIIESFDRRIEVADTPGSNPMTDQFDHNLEIAHALNFAPVSCIVIVVKAEPRMDNPVAKVSEYAERFLPESMPVNLLGVCMTHMDTVKWNRADMMPCLNDLGLTNCLFTGLQTPREELVQNLVNLSQRGRPTEMHIDGAMFLTIFKISNKNIGILRQVRREVGRFTKMKADFYLKKANFPDRNDQMNMTFEFQAFMLHELQEAQKNLATKNGFDFMGDDKKIAGEAGHYANMTNQLRAILRDIRTEAAQYHMDVNSPLRKCPHCPAVWTLVEGCDGTTTCGARPSNQTDHWSGVLSTFRFRFNNNELEVTKLENKAIPNRNTTSNKSYGCGANISFKNMAPVHLPNDPSFTDAFRNTKDLEVVPAEKHEDWEDLFQKKFKRLAPLTVIRK